MDHPLSISAAKAPAAAGLGGGGDDARFAASAGRDPARSGAPRSIPTHGQALEPARVSDAQMRLILDISRLLAVPTDLDKLLERIAEMASALLGCERASIFLHDPVPDELCTRVAMLSREIRVPSNAGIVGAAFSGNQIINVRDPYSDPRFNPEPDRRSGFRTRSLLTAPMADIDGKPRGVIQAVNKLESAFDDNDVSLIQLLAEQAGVALQRHRLQQAAMEFVALRHEMTLARRTQESLIPKAPPTVDGLDAVGWSLPASVTGGDCFDLWTLSDGRLGILLADASGHGLGPAMVVSQARTLVRAMCEIETDPHALLALINNRLCEDLSWGQFVTAFLGFLSPQGELHWSSAGHGPIFWRPEIDKPLLPLEAPVQPLGVIEPWLDGPPPPLQLGMGGSLILVSDGIFEAPDPAGEQYGVERMVDLIDQLRYEPPAAILAALKNAVANWHVAAEPIDDQTVVIVQRAAPQVKGA